MIGFSDTTQLSQISSILQSSIDRDNYEPYGVSWGDLNNDNYPDVYLNHHNQISPQILVNQSDGTFTDSGLTLGAGDDHGAGWFDFDNDGDDDLFQSVGLLDNSPRSDNRFLINENGILVDRAATVGLTYSEGRGRTPIAFDYDGDGLLDIFYSALFESTKGILPSTVFHQLPDNTFEDVGSELGFDSSLNNPFGLLSDLSGNGVLDLILMPDASRRPNVYDTTSTPFVEIGSNLLPEIPQLSYRPNAMAGDLNGDLIPDLIFSNIGSFRDRTTVLLLSSEEGWFDASVSSGIGEMLEGLETGYGGPNLGDLDNDGDLDIYFATNIPESTVDETTINPSRSNIIAENQGDGTFVAVEDLGVAEGTSLGASYSTTLVDYNLDGFLDLFLSNASTDLNSSSQNAYQLLENQGNDNHWILIDLEGTESNRDGIGAKVYVTAGGVTQLREQDGGIHSRSQDHKRLHIGLAQNEQIDEILVQWSSGRESRLTNVAADRLIEIVEPSSTVYQPEESGLLLSVNATSNAGFVNVGGFYQAIDLQGTVIDPLTGSEVSIEDDNYETVALANSVARLGDGESTILEFDGDFVYVPYLLADGKRFFTAYETVNADGLEHVKSMGENTFGFEDLLGGGDLDFDDYIIEIV